MKILLTGPQELHAHRQTYQHDEANTLSFFHNLTSSTFPPNMWSVTVAPDYTQWHTPHSVWLLWASDRPVAEKKLVVAFHNSVNSPKNHHLSRSAACIIYHHVMRRPLIAIWGYGLQICRLGANIYRANRLQHSKGLTEWRCYSSPSKSWNVMAYYTRRRNFTFRNGLINGEGKWCLELGFSGRHIRLTVLQTVARKLQNMS